MNETAACGSLPYQKEFQTFKIYIALAFPFDSNMEPKMLKGKDFFILDVRMTALLVIDMQNEFVEAGAHCTAYPASLEIIPKIGKIIEFARKHSMPVIWTQCDHSFPGAGILLKKAPPIAKQKVLWEGTRSFQFFSNMTQPLPEEYKIVKHKYDSFDGTDMETILRNLKIESIIITGISTEVCCESTARTAFHRDLQVTFISDATATRTMEAHKATLEAIDNYFGRVMTTDDLLIELEESISMTAASKIG